MEDRGRPGLNNPAIRARLAQTHRRTGPVDFAVKPGPSIPVAPPMVVRPVNPMINIVAPQPYSRPAHPKLQQSKVLRRQSVQKPSRIAVSFDPEYVEVPKRLKRTKLLNPKFKFAAAGFVVLGVLFGFASVINVFVGKNDQINPVSVVGTETMLEKSDPSKLVELRPTANALSGYSVPADEPKIITIPKLYVYARIKPVGISANSELKLTNNIFDAGWFNTSGKPGSADSSVMVINGHSAGPNQAGLFPMISTLVAGDSIKITRGDGQPFSYSVVKVQILEPSNVDPNLMSMSVETGKAGLNLIACDDNRTSEVGDCRQRVIVYAVKSS